MSQKFRKWLAQLLWNVRQKPAQFKGLRVLSVPQRFESNVVYVVGDDDCDWAAVLLCPCGCRDAIHLSLVTDSTPSWRVRIYRNKQVTLIPSVWRTVGCKSHFIVHRGHVFWCSDDTDDWLREI